MLNLFVCPTLLEEQILNYIIIKLLNEILNNYTDILKEHIKGTLI